MHSSRRERERERAHRVRGDMSLGPSQPPTGFPMMPPRPVVQLDVNAKPWHASESRVLVINRSNLRNFKSSIPRVCLDFQT